MRRKLRRLMFRRGMGKSLEIRPSQNVNELEADKLVVTNFTANKLTVNTLVVNSSGIVNVADTLTAGNIQLFASQLTAGTIITDGDIGRDYLDDRIKATTGNLEARNVKGLDITVAKNLIASGDVRVYDRVTVNGDLTAKNVTQTMSMRKTPIIVRTAAKSRRAPSTQRATSRRREMSR